jgi:hypothetical protein
MVRHVRPSQITRSGLTYKEKGTFIWSKFEPGTYHTVCHRFHEENALIINFA